MLESLKPGLIYLASPYTHPDPIVREARFCAACRQAARMIQNRILVFSPVAYGHVVASYGLPLDWTFWEPFDQAFLELCSEVWVLTLDGWQESKGVQAEITIAQKLNKPVVWVAPLDGVGHVRVT